MWNRRRGAAWSKVTLRKDKGGLAIRDFEKMNEVATVKDAIKIWEEGGSAWSRWMCGRYVGDSALEDIGPRSILSVKNKIAACIDLGRNQRMKWKGVGLGPSARNIFVFLRHTGEKDSFARGLWASMVPKMRLTLWKLRWHRLHSFRAVCQWGGQAPDHCFLCREEEETEDNLFFICAFKGILWLIRVIRVYLG